MYNPLLKGFLIIDIYRLNMVLTNMVLTNVVLTNMVLTKDYKLELL